MGILSDIAAKCQLRETTVVDPVFENVMLCNANVNRYAVGFSVPVANTTVVTTNPGDPNNGGIAVGQGDIVWIRIDQAGAFAQTEWWARPGAGVTTVTVFELIFPGG